MIDRITGDDNWFESDWGYECTVNRVQALKDLCKTVRDISEINRVQQTVLPAAVVVGSQPASTPATTIRMFKIAHHTTSKFLSVMFHWLLPSNQKLTNKFARTQGF